MSRNITTEDALRMMKKMQSSGGGGASSLTDLGITATATELNYVKGVTSSIQTQLNGKVPTSRTINGKALTGNITLSASDVGASASDHNHDTIYAKIDHTHTGYAPSNHNHDTVYSKLEHGHDYLPLAGGTLTGALSGTNFTASGTLKVSGTSTQGRINASNIYLSGSLYAGGKTSTTDGHNGVALGSSGSIYLQGSNPTVVFTQAGTTTVGARIFISTTDGYNYLKFKADNKYLVFREAKDEGYTYSSYFYGETDGGTTLGTASFRFYRLYATNSSISTSDRRQKENIKALKKAKKTRKRADGKTEDFDVYSELFDRLEPVEYNFINGEKRKSFGLIAQDVLESMNELGIEEDELDLVHHEKWTDQTTGEEKDAYGIAYENLISMLIHEVQKLKG